jgi:hypothetical protein
MLPTRLLPNKLLFFRYQPSPYNNCQVEATKEFFLFAVSIVPSSDTKGKSEVYIPTKYKEYADLQSVTNGA